VRTIDLGEAPAELVIAAGLGEITILRYADGSLLRTGRVPWTARKAGDGAYAC